MTKFIYPFRYLLQVKLEAEAPLRIGSGEKGIQTDSLVIRDVNGLPFIPGTTLAGLLSHALKEMWDKKKTEDLMGSQEKGSRIIVTEAKLLDRNGKPLDGLIDFSEISKEDRLFLDIYERLPIRQHVRINEKGCALDGGKFDEEVILKGSRFCFEMELLAKADEREAIDALFSILYSPVFRVGSGSRSGFGEVKVVQSRQRALNLNKPEDRSLYLEKSSRIGSEWAGWEDVVPGEGAVSQLWTSYRLNLQPKDFMMFSSGFADPEGADMTYVREAHIDWSSGTGELVKQENTVLIPASSVKGALSHRTAFHYNRLTDAVLQKDGTLKEKTKEEVTGNKNIAVRAIFGSEGEKKRGNILISDVIQTKRETSSPKVLNHVSIDRFTGGAVDGALFQEQVLYAEEEIFQINLMLADTAIVDLNIRKAFESALKDVVSGMLPLGGGVNRGNGVFTGSAEKFNKEKKQWEKLT